MELQILPDNPEIAAFYSNWSNEREDSGFDLYCAEDQVIPAGALGVAIKFGIKCEVSLNTTFKEDFTKVSSGAAFMLLPRSSISNTPLRMSNSIGLVDVGYRGYIMAKVDNLSKEDFTIHKGERYFQLVFPGLKPLETVKIVDSLSESLRGMWGFGSTGR